MADTPTENLAPAASEAAVDEALPIPPASPDELGAAAVALLLSAGGAVPMTRLADALGGVPAAEVRAALDAAAARLAEAGLPADLVEVGGGLRFLTRPEHEDYMARLHRTRRDERLSTAALETLSVVAYKQPVSRAEVERIRGVQAGPVLRSLLDRGLLRVAGREEVPGRPLLYGTTRRFLDVFGLGSVEDLPDLAEDPFPEQESIDEEE